ncbi:MAG: regulator [Bacteroidales bacterium]|nr:regulator [Bacteroidales bacterium]
MSRPVNIDNSANIYSANNIGMLEFDGIEWSFYPSPNASVIRSVAVDKRNRIFTSGYRELGYWSKDTLGTMNYHSLNDKAEPLFAQNEEFWTILAQGNKTYFHSFTSLFIYDNTIFKVIRPGHLINSIGVYQDTVLLHVADLGIFKVRDTVLVPFITNEDMKQASVKFMITDEGGKLIIGTSGEGLFVYDGGRLLPFLAQWKDELIKSEINRAAFTKKGKLIIGTILNGIFIFDRDGNLLERINKRNGLQNNTVLGIYIDSFDNIWLALDRGIDFISLNPDPSYKIESPEMVGAVYTAAFYNNKLYLGTNQGVYFRDRPESGQPFSFLEGSQGQVWDLNVFKRQLIIGHNNGTFLLNGRGVEKISEIGGGLNMASNPKDKESIIQCTYSNIIFYGSRGGTVKVDHVLSRFNNLIRYLEMDHLNNLWASHMYRGVFKVKMNDRQDSILSQKYFGAETFGQGNNIQVFKIEDRVIFTTSRIIYTYDDIRDTIIPFTRLNELLGPFKSAHKVIAAPGHNYWFISNTGIGLYSINGEVIEPVRVYPTELFKDHLIIGFENIIPLDSETAFLCLDNGFAILYTNRKDISRQITDKRLLLKSIEISDARGNIQRQNLNQSEIEVPFNKNSLVLKFSFPFYSTDPIMFQSFIQGMDTGWSRPAAKPEFNFKRIPPGEYTISVRALNNWFETSKTESLKVRVFPPWYLSGLSIVAYILIIVLFVVFFRRILISRFRLREQKIREAKERELIRLKNEKLNSELSYKSQELANSTMSIIKKNEFLIDLRDIIKSQKEELGLRYPDKYYQKLMRKIDTNISSMDDWKIFEIHFERAHEKFLHKLMNKFPSLTPGDLRLCAYLRMNLSSKEIAPLLKISVRGVENHRYKLRKKLNLKPDENLIDFILGL